MNDVDLAAIIQNCMIVTVKMSGPLLGAALLSGLMISIIQAITQINEATLVFLPKVIALGIVILLLGPFMIGTLKTFSHEIFDQMVAIGSS